MCVNLFGIQLNVLLLLPDEDIGIALPFTKLYSMMGGAMVGEYLMAGLYLPVDGTPPKPTSSNVRLQGLPSGKVYAM